MKFKLLTVTVNIDEEGEMVLTHTMGGPPLPPQVYGRLCADLTAMFAQMLADKVQGDPGEAYGAILAAFAQSLMSLGEREVLNRPAVIH